MTPFVFVLLQLCASLYASDLGNCHDSSGMCQAKEPPVEVEEASVLLQNKAAVTQVETESKSDEIKWKKHPSSSWSGQADALLQSIQTMAQGAPPDRDMSQLKIIKQILVETLLPGLMEAHEFAQGQLNDAKGEIDDCNTDVDTGMVSVNALKSITSDAETNHSSCRTKEKGLIAVRDGACDNMNDFLRTADEPGTPASRDVNAVRPVWDEYCRLASKLSTLEAKCNSSTTDASEEKVLCDRNQSTFESHFCEYRDGLENLEVASIKCYDKKKAAYERLKATMPAKEDHWAAEYNAMKKIECYLGVWLSDDNVSTVNLSHKCAGKFDTSVVSLDYPDVPSRTEVDVSPVQEYPGKEDFKLRYADFPYSAVTPCVLLTTTTSSMLSATSCADIPDGADGEYTLKAEDGSDYTTKCSFSTSGGKVNAATLVGRVNIQGNKWTYATTSMTGLGDDSGSSTPWETSDIFGSLAGDGDFKNPGWWSAVGSSLRITYNAEFLMQTAAGCLAGKSLSAKFAGLSWDAAGSAHIDHATAIHKCTRDASMPPQASEAVEGLGSTPANIVFQWGEKNGVQDGNRDRVYISTDGVGGANVDAPQGLGSFMSSNGAVKTSVNVGKNNDRAVTVAGSGYYELWVVDEAVKKDLVTTTTTTAGTVASCADIVGGTDGEYTLKAEDGSDYTTKCSFSTSGGKVNAATLVGRVNIQGNKWTYATTSMIGLGDDSGSSTPWETSDIFGSLAGDGDFKNPGWWSAVGSSLRITYNAEFLMQTVAGCLAGKSLSAKFAGLSWDAAGSAHIDHATAIHKCTRDASMPPQASEAVEGLGSKPANIVFQWGEKNGVQDGNRDRVYISTDGVGGANVDAPQGLGSFMSSNSAVQTSVNVGKNNDRAVTVAGSGYYELWVVSEVAK